MTEPARSFVIGVDAGGTKTTAWLAGTEPDAVVVPDGRGAGGAANMHANGFAHCADSVHGAIRLALRDAGVDSRHVVSLCLSIAGAGREGDRERWSLWAQQHFPESRIHVTGDAEPVLAAVAATQEGLVIISGTGSLAWGRTESGSTARAGGWGYLLGDEGSGYAISIAALRAAVRFADGIGPRTDLLPGLLEYFDCAEPSALVGRIYASDMSRRRIASAAAVVFEHSETDEVAEKIVQHAAAELACAAEGVRTKLGLSTADLVLALAGGVVVHQPAYRTAIAESLRLRPHQMTVVPEPVAGAVQMARAIAESHRML